MTAPVLDPVDFAPSSQAPAPQRRAPQPRRQSPAAAPARHLRVVGHEQEAKEASQRRLVRRTAAVAAVVAALSVFGVVVFHVVLTQNQFRLDRLRVQSSVRQAEYDRLRLQVAQLESPDRVVAEAQQRLGMVTPPRVTYLTPSVDEPSANVEAPAAAAQPSAIGAAWSTVKPHLAEG